MVEGPYAPVSCELHSRLELAAMHGRPVCLRLRDGSELRGIIEDIWTEAGHEYLRLGRPEGTATIDLAHITDFQEPSTLSR